MENLPKNMQVGPPRAVVIGVSAGGLTTMRVLLPLIPADFPLPVIIAQHLHPSQDGTFTEILDNICALRVTEAEEKQEAAPGAVYFAPSNYHLLVESDETFSLSIDEKVNFSRPSIDVLFESAADAYGSGLIGVILTGAGRDGAAGLRRIKEKGGITIVQDPTTAEFPMMPQAALDETQADYVISIEEIGRLLIRLGRRD